MVGPMAMQSFAIVSKFPVCDIQLFVKYMKEGLNHLRENSLLRAR